MSQTHIQLSTRTRYCIGVSGGFVLSALLPPYDASCGHATCLVAVFALALVILSQSLIKLINT